MGGATGRALRLDVAEIIEARMRELFEKLGEEMATAGTARGCPPAWCSPAAARCCRAPADLGREVLDMPVRVAVPAGVGGLTDGLIAAPYATAIGLLQWAARVVTSPEPHRYESAPAGGSMGRVRDFFKGLFP